MDSSLLKFVTVKHTCGHTVTYHPKGLLAERIRQVNKLNKSPCAACQEAAIKRKTEEAVASMGLPPLTGSVDRYPYANQLRYWIYSQPDREMDKALYAAYDVRRLEYCHVVGQDRDKMESGRLARTVESFRTWLRDHDDAQWWGRPHGDNPLKKVATEYFDQILQTLAQETPQAKVPKPDDTI